MSPTTVVLRSIPLLGWLCLAVGAAAMAAGRMPRHPLWRGLWWCDAVLSIVVHAAQIPAALRRRGEVSVWRTVILTQVFGLTWWRTQPAAVSR